ncbi:hypothetical protein J5X84_11470 [Streptosporangiaceae bacterium NEAU-GS5]|nr:hypothetical protein [Streptosporangiaceae bacterium NEAU-GS5]
MATDRSPGGLEITLAVLSAAVAAFYFAGAPGSYGIFLVAVGCLLFGWAGAVVVRPGSRVYATGAFLHLGLFVIWLVGRVAGVPFGPNTWTAKPSGPPGLIGATFETLIVVICLAVLAEVRASRRTVLVATVLGGAVAAISVLAMGRTGPPLVAHQHAAAAVQQPGGPTDAQITAADALVQATRRQAPTRWPTLDDAERDGYLDAFDSGSGPGQIVHVVKSPLLQDGVILDPNRPESLVYARLPSGETTLLGAMYIMPPGQIGPQIGGPITRWHTHGDLCLNGTRIALRDAGGTCPAGSKALPVTPEMLHLWLVDVPGGPYSEASDATLRAAAARV